MKPLVAGLFPCIFNDNSLVPHLHHHVVDLFGDDFPRRHHSRRARRDPIRNHPSDPSPTDAILKWLVEPYVNRLTKGGTSAWDVNNLHSHLLDPMDYRCHHVALVAVEGVFLACESMRWLPSPSITPTLANFVLHEFFTNSILSCG